MLRNKVLWLSLLCLTASTAFAQYTVKKIIFDGTMPYSQSDLELASGLKPGDQISKQTMQEAAQRLSDTGAFGDIQVTVDGSVKAISVIFKVKPTDPSRMLAVGFNNFIWWPHDQLVAEVHQRVPLFNGSVPEAGSLQQSLQDALQQMLNEKQITAKLSSKIYDMAPGAPVRSIEYHIDSPDIKLHAFKVDGVSPDHAAEIEKVTASLADSNYNEGLRGSAITDRILVVYRNAGYLDASLDNFNRTLTTPTPGHIDVDLSAAIKPGKPYHIAKIDWPGSPILDAADFTAAAPIHPGDLASQKTLSASLAIIDNAYRHLGYLDAAIDAVPQLDSAAHLVSYTFAVTPGDQYRLREVQVAGLTPDLRQTFDTAWKMHAEDLYDATYLTTFLKANVAQPYLQPYTVTYRIVRDPDTHLVTLIFVFEHHHA